MYTSRERAGLDLGLGVGLELELGLGFHTSPPRKTYNTTSTSNSNLRFIPPSRYTSSNSSTSRCFDKTRKTVGFDHRNPPLGRSQSVNRSRTGSYTTNGKPSCGNNTNNHNTNNRRRRNDSPTTFSRPQHDTMDSSKGGESADLDVLLRRLSVLQLEMKDLLNGRSLKDRLHVIGQKMDGNVNHFSTSYDNCHSSSGSSSTSSSGRDHHAKGKSRANEKNNESKGLLQNHSNGSKEKGKKHSMSKKEEEREEGRVATRREDHGGGSHGKIEEKEAKYDTMDELARETSADISEERKQIIHLWQEYNCDLHLKRIIDVSRKDAAFRMLEKVIHSRLTHYMLQYVAAVAKGLIGDEKTHYLCFFKREGPFRTKPLNEGTYCELLNFVCKQPNPARDVVKALEVSEEGLEEEGGRAGYNPTMIGNVRAQMRVFLSIAGSYANTVASQTESVEDLFTCEFLKDIIHAANQGKLGALQNAHQLIKLACFLVLKQMDISFIG